MNATPKSAVNWGKRLAPYQKSDTRKSLWQLANTLIPYLALWALMLYSVRLSYWLTLALALPTAGFMVRTFIIFHDCGHGSFFKSKKANLITGIITGILTYTPWHRWWHDHAVHHATVGDLDRRGTGDVYTMTVEEYLAAPWWRKLGYRVMRNPIALLVIGPPIIFAIVQRFPSRKDGPREKASVWWTNLALAALVGALVWLVGWKTFLMVQIPVLMLGTSAGVWLFYVQHNYEGTSWLRHKDWDYYRAALEGSSYYKLPALLNWFTGNIGLHHIHHLGPRIPNYNLPRALRDIPALQIHPLTLRQSLRSLRLRLWDEKNHKMVGWEAVGHLL